MSQERQLNSQSRNSETIKQLKEAMTTTEQALKITKELFPEKTQLGKTIDQATYSLQTVRNLLPSTEEAVTRLNQRLADKEKKRSESNRSE